MAKTAFLYRSFAHQEKNRSSDHSHKTVIFLLCFLIILMLAGCASLPVTAPPQSMPLSPEARWQQLNDTKGTPRALKALARIDLITQSGRYPLKVAILLQNPDRFRMESLPLFGPPNLYLTVENSELKVFLPEQGKYYIGTSSQKELASFIPLISSRFQLSDMFALLRGTVPLIQDQDVTLKGFQEQEYYRLEVYRGQQKVQVLWLKPESNQLIRAALWGKNNDFLYTAQFEEYGHLKEEVNFPAKISVKLEPPDPASLTLWYTDLQLLQEIQPEAFSLKVPPGIEPIRLNKK